VGKVKKYFKNGTTSGFEAKLDEVENVWTVTSCHENGNKHYVVEFSLQKETMKGIEYGETDEEMLYDGDFKWSKKKFKYHGEGTVFLSNGEEVKGEFEKGHLKSESPAVLRYKVSGNRFDWKVKQQKRNKGYNIHTAFKKFVPVGDGIYTFKNKRFCRGIFEPDKDFPGYLYFKNEKGLCYFEGKFDMSGNPKKTDVVNLRFVDGVRSDSFLFVVKDFNSSKTAWPGILTRPNHTKKYSGTMDENLKYKGIGDLYDVEGRIIYRGTFDTDNKRHDQNGVIFLRCTVVEEYEIFGGDIEHSCVYVHGEEDQDNRGAPDPVHEGLKRFPKNLMKKTMGEVESDLEKIAKFLPYILSDKKLGESQHKAAWEILGDLRLLVMNFLETGINVENMQPADKKKYLEIYAYILKLVSGDGVGKFVTQNMPEYPGEFKRHFIDQVLIYQTLVEIHLEILGLDEAIAKQTNHPVSLDNWEKDINDPLKSEKVKFEAFKKKYQNDKRKGVGALYQQGLKKFSELNFLALWHEKGSERHGAIHHARNLRDALKGKDSVSHEEKKYIQSLLDTEKNIFFMDLESNRVWAERNFRKVLSELEEKKKLGEIQEGENFDDFLGKMETNLDDVVAKKERKEALEVILNPVFKILSPGNDSYRRAKVLFPFLRELLEAVGSSTKVTTHKHFGNLKKFSDLHKDVKQLFLHGELNSVCNFFKIDTTKKTISEIIHAIVEKITQLEENYLQNKANILKELKLYKDILDFDLKSLNDKRSEEEKEEIQKFVSDIIATVTKRNKVRKIRTVPGHEVKKVRAQKKVVKQISLGNESDVEFDGEGNLVEYYSDDDFEEEKVEEAGEKENEEPKIEMKKEEKVVEEPVVDENEEVEEKKEENVDSTKDNKVSASGSNYGDIVVPREFVEGMSDLFRVPGSQPKNGEKNTEILSKSREPRIKNNEEFADYFHDGTVPENEDEK